MKARTNKKYRLWYQREFNKYDNKSWRKRLWFVFNETGVFEGPRRFLNRNAAIMWLKRYGGNFMAYKLNGKLVCTIDGYVYFYSRECNLMITAESKKTHAYAVRDN